MFLSVFTIFAVYFNNFTIFQYQQEFSKTMKFKKPLLLTIIAVVFALVNIVNKDGQKPPTPQTTSSKQQNATQAIATAMHNHAHKIWVYGAGKVVALLADDTQGARHQRILVAIPGTRQTVLIAHNIDLAPRVDRLKKGETISFAGEYIWNDKGGVLHWTHHDPQGRKKGGWIEVHGRKYQ